MASKISRERPLLLASASPRRRELLMDQGIALTVRAVEVDESPRAGEDAGAYLERVVADKARAAAEAARAVNVAAVLVADTVVVHDGVILGKPRDDDDARAMIGRLAGGPHTVSTRYAIDPFERREGAARTVSTTVWFRALSSRLIERYVATGEGRDKAGAYAIQGIGAMLVERIDGDYANVVGLPICAVVQSLEQLGLLEP